MKNTTFLVLVFILAIFSNASFAAAPDLDGDWYFQSGSYDGEQLTSLKDLEVAPDNSYAFFKIRGDTLSMVYGWSSSPLDGSGDIESGYGYMPMALNIKGSEMHLTINMEGELQEMVINFKVLGDGLLQVSIEGFMDEDIILVLKKSAE